MPATLDAAGPAARTRAGRKEAGNLARGLCRQPGKGDCRFFLVSEGMTTEATRTVWGPGP